MGAFLKYEIHSSRMCASDSVSCKFSTSFFHHFFIFQIFLGYSVPQIWHNRYKFGILRSLKLINSTTKRISIAPNTAQRIIHPEAAEKPNTEPSITRKATPKVAPLLTPNTEGPAKGLRKSVCICKPLSERATPAITAVSALGKRSCIKIRCSNPSVHKADSGISAAPTIKSITNSSRSRRMSMGKMHFFIAKPSCTDGSK